uniref:Uncharacterized protein n=1 Tax=Streptomyces sp. NBC_00180 TaxID=2903632 RepID=A0AAU1HW41_9ACTN
MLISPAVSIVLGAKNLSDAEGLLASGSSGVSQLRLRSTRRLDLGQTAVQAIPAEQLPAERLWAKSDCLLCPLSSRLVVSTQMAANRRFDGEPGRCVAVVQPHRPPGRRPERHRPSAPRARRIRLRGHPYRLPDRPDVTREWLHREYVEGLREPRPAEHLTHEAGDVRHVSGRWSTGHRRVTASYLARDRLIDQAIK